MYYNKKKMMISIMWVIIGATLLVLGRISFYYWSSCCQYCFIRYEDDTDWTDCKLLHVCSFNALLDFISGITEKVLNLLKIICTQYIDIIYRLRAAASSQLPYFF